MSGIKGFCKHGITWRNCYSCHLEFTYSQDKTPMDTIHETISELKIRVSKLEEYKRLQDDENKTNNRRFARFNEDIKNHGDVIANLEHHRKIQIDENRSVYRHLTDLEESYQGLSAELRHLLEQQEYVPFVESDYIDKQKTTGLTFDEAIKHFIKGKSIRYFDGMTQGNLYTPHECVSYYFDYGQMRANHWEVVP